MEPVDWIPIIVTAVATAIVAIAAVYNLITNRRLWLNIPSLPLISLFNMIVFRRVSVNLCIARWLIVRGAG